jgi:hypothetical protein
MHEYESVSERMTNMLQRSCCACVQTGVRVMRMRARTQVQARAQERESERGMYLACNSHASEAGSSVTGLLINTTAHEVQHAARSTLASNGKSAQTRANGQSFSVNEELARALCEEQRDWAR